MHHPRLTFANVLSCLALFVALGGASYAAVTLPKNSVGRSQIKAGAIDNSKVKSGSLRRSSFKAGTLKPGPMGPQGLVGAKGDTGPQGVGGGAIKLAGDSHFAVLDLPGDSQWHDYATVTFTAAANTIYSPTYFNDYGLYQMTGASCVSGLGVISRELVNGVNVTQADANGYSYPAQFYGPYPAGTAMTMQLQYNLDCATQTYHLPGGELMLVPYQTA